MQDIDLKSLMVNICFKLPLQSTYLLLDLKSQNKLQKVRVKGEMNVSNHEA